MIKPINKDMFLLMQKARPATIMDIQTANNLNDTLLDHENHCAGMAANMIGEPVAIISFFNGDTIMEMFNPEIIKKAGKYETKEGCLSLTGERPVTRYKEITVKWQDRNFKKHTGSFTGFVAETIQHEVDHLNGIII